MTDDISTKGLDGFAKNFLIGDSDADSEYIVAAKGQQASEEALARYMETRKEEFVRRAGQFTEDMVAHFVEQKKMLNLTDVEALFAVALFTINLRNSFTSPQTEEEEKNFTLEHKKKLEKQFDEICWGAQQFWEANKT